MFLLPAPGVGEGDGGSKAGTGNMSTSGVSCPVSGAMDGVCLTWVTWEIR